MRKKLFIWSSALLTLVSCGKEQTTKSVTRPVKVATIESLGSIEKSYTGIVSPDEFSNLAFKMGGTITAMNVTDGERVKRGEVVAEIDSKDFELDLAAKQAQYIKAKSQMERASRLVEKDVISQQEYETTNAAYVSAKSAYDNAKNTIADTKLIAPFDGFIQKKYVENHQRVQPGEGVVCLINPRKLQVEFTIPETNIVYFDNDCELFIEFDAYRGKLFKAQVKQYVEASTNGAGVPVYLSIDDPEFDYNKYKISVGFSCRVILNVVNDELDSNTMTLPISAVVFDNTTNKKSVFVFNPSEQRVERRYIEDDGVIVGRNDLIVEGDIKVGESVVIAGASRLTDGQRVKVLHNN